jgi:hypothetical protein
VRSCLQGLLIMGCRAFVVHASDGGHALPAPPWAPGLICSSAAVQHDR